MTLCTFTRSALSVGASTLKSLWRAYRTIAANIGKSSKARRGTVPRPFHAPIMCVRRTLVKIIHKEKDAPKTHRTGPREKGGKTHAKQRGGMESEGKGAFVNAPNGLPFFAIFCHFLTLHPQGDAGGLGKTHTPPPGGSGGPFPPSLARDSPSPNR